MANNIKGITIEIGGNTQPLQKAIGDVNAKISNTQKELKEVDRLLKMDPGNTELLKQKQELLAKSIGDTNSKLSTLKDAMKQMDASGADKSSEQYRALEREIIATEQSLNRLTSEQSKTTDALKGATDGANAEADALDKTSKEAKGADDSHAALGAALKASAKFFADLGAAALDASKKMVSALVDASKEGAQYADDINTLSKVTGMSTDALQRYSYVADLVDVSTETMTGSLQKSLSSMQAAARGTAAYTQAYEKLGVSVTDADGNLRSSQDVWNETIMALGRINDETERDALAMQVFGRSAQELNPLIETGVIELSKMMEQADAAGAVLDKNTLDSYNDFSDNLTKMTSGAKAAKNALGTVLLPALTKLSGTGVDLLGQFTNAIANSDGDFGKMADSISTLIPQALETIQNMVPELLDMLGGMLDAVLHLLDENADPIFRTLIDVIVKVLEMVTSKLPTLIEVVIGVVVDLLNALADNAPVLVPILVDALVLLIKTVMEHLPEIMRALMLVAMEIEKAFMKELPGLFSTIGETFVAIAPELFGIFVEYASFAWEQIKNVFSKVGAFFGDVFSAAGKKVKNAFVDIVNAIIGGINKALGFVTEKLRSINLMGWKPFESLGNISIPELPKMATGGTIRSGSAIVGEAGMELLTMNNGAATVQPLTARIDSGDLRALTSGGGDQNIQVVLNFDGNLAQLARVLNPSIQAENARVGASLVLAKGV